MGLELLKERLEKLRRKNGLTQKEMAKSLGINPATFSAYEKGKNNPSLEVLIKISELYNVSLDWLCGLSNIKNKNSNTITLNNYGDIIYFFSEIGRKINITLYIPAVFEKITNREDFKKYIDIKDELIDTFIDEWDKILSLYRNGTINENLYNLWINDQINKHKKIPLENDNLIPDADEWQLSEDLF